MYKDSENGQMPTNMCTWTTPGKHLTLRTKPVVSSSLSVEPRSPCIVSCTVSSPMHDPVVQTFKWTCGSAQPVNDHVVGFLICTLQCFRPVACNLLLCEGRTFAARCFYFTVVLCPPCFLTEQSVPPNSRWRSLLWGGLLDQTWSSEAKSAVSLKTTLAS